MTRMFSAVLLPIAALRRRLSHCRTLFVAVALSLASCALPTELPAQRTYTYECVGQAKPKRGDTLVVQRDSSRADTASNCTRQLVRPVVTPPVNPPVIPVGSGEPVFGAGDVVILRDSMDQYVSKAAMATTANGFRPGEDPRNELVLVSPGRGGTGKALRIAYLGQSQTGASWDTYPQGAKGPDTATHVVQFYGRLTFSAPLTSTVGIKWAMLWHRSGNDRIQFHTHWNPPQSGCSYSRSDVPPWTRWMVIDQGRFTNCQAMQPVPPFIENVADGQWHRFTHEYRPNSRAGARDGIARMWIDGVKMVDVSAAMCGGVPVVPVGAHLGKPWCGVDDLDKLAVADGIAYLKLGGALTTVVPQFNMDVDHLLWFRR